MLKHRQLRIMSYELGIDASATHYELDNIELLKIYTTMSQNSKIKRERYAKKQEKEGKKVVEYIVWGLIILGIAFAVWTFTQA